MPVNITGGDKLFKYLERAKAVKASGQVGFFPESIYDNGVQVAQVAMENEFGKVNKGVDAEKYGSVIPPRSFMRSTFSEQSKKWSEEFKKRVLSSPDDIDVLKPIEFVCKLAKIDIQEKINWWATSGSPRNGPKVQAIKGFDSPLIWSGKMLHSVNYVVRSERVAEVKSES